MKTGKQKIKIKLLAITFFVVSLLLPLLMVRNLTYAQTPLSPPITPPINRKPIILTTALPQGQVNVKYKAVVKVIDRDNDLVEVVILNLPNKLGYQCSSIPGKTSCTIWGKPQNTGSYLVKVTADDHRGGSVYRDYQLVITP